jgi:hypothetical protein
MVSPRQTPGLPLSDLPTAAERSNLMSRLTGGASLPAHAHVRYLGEFSGGQMLGSIVAQSLPIEGIPATSFYDFGDGRADAGMRPQAFRTGLAWSTSVRRRPTSWSTKAGAASTAPPTLRATARHLSRRTPPVSVLTP